MSEQTDTCTDTAEIYIPLLNEGTNVFRPTRGLPLGAMRFQVLPTPDYSPELETWEFSPGSIVECKIENWSGQEVMVARSRLS
jgi:hypothetical protein